MSEGDNLSLLAIQSMVAKLSVGVGVGVVGSIIANGSALGHGSVMLGLPNMDTFV